MQQYTIMAWNFPWWLGSHEKSIQTMHVVENDTDDTDKEVSHGLEIKTPSSKKLLPKTTLPARSYHGMFSRCLFGDNTFKQLVHK